MTDHSSAASDARKNGLNHEGSTPSLADSLRHGLASLGGFAQSGDIDHVANDPEFNEQENEGPLVRPSTRREPSAAAREVIRALFEAAGQVTPAPQTTPKLPTPTPPTPTPTPKPPLRPAAKTTLVDAAAVMRSFSLALPDGTVVGVGSGLRVVLGRELADDVTVVDFREVSRRHVAIENRLGRLTATDLGASNGTRRLRTGAPVVQLTAHEPTELFAGDQLDVFSGVELCTVSEWLGEGRG
jgi:FHA domain